MKKELGLLDVYAIAMGTTLSSGFFLLPGLAFLESGTSMVTSYLLAAILVVPALFSLVELSTAMPKAGGLYYFVDRSMGPMMGAVAGLGTWIVLILKSAFALIGLGAYVGLFIPDLPIVPVALVLCGVFGLLNLAGAKKTGSLQIVMVLFMMAILTGFLGIGSTMLKADQLTELFRTDMHTLLATTGMVYISYAGLTKVTSVAEEVRDPEKNIPRGMFLALFSAVIVYVVGTDIMISVVPPGVLSGDLTPVASAAFAMVGNWGVWAVSGAAVLGFFAAANAGILSASRFPLAMSRDALMPKWFSSMSASGIPRNAIYATVGLIAVVIVGLDPLKIAKLAGAFQLIMFALACMAVIVMRESHIASYDSGYKSPFYPWMQLAGIVIPFVIIGEMGGWSIAFSFGLLGVTIMWYFWYAAGKVHRDGAIYHWFARLGEKRYEGLDRELRGILKEKGLRSEDPFDQIVARSGVIEAEADDSFLDTARKASRILALSVDRTPEQIERSFMEGTRTGATPVTHQVALPHFRVAGLSHPQIVLARSKAGIHIVANDPLLDEPEESDVHAIFFLISAEEDPGQHLRLLAQIAGRVDDDTFMKEWLDAPDAQDLREVLLRDEHFMTLAISDSSTLVGKELKNISIPEGCLIAMIRRDRDILVPRGNTMIQSGDRLTIIGEPKGLEEVRRTLI